MNVRNSSRNDDNEIKNIPTVTQVGVLSKDKAEAEDLEDHFQCVQDVEHVVDLLENWVRVLSSRIVDDHDSRVGNDDADTDVLEGLGRDDLEADHLEENEHSANGLTALKQWEPVRVDLQLLKRIFRLLGQDLVVLLLDLLDVGVLLDAAHVLLLPVAHGVEPSLLQLLESQPFRVVDGIERRLWKLLLVHVALVADAVRDQGARLALRGLVPVVQSCGQLVAQHARRVKAGLAFSVSRVCAWSSPISIII